MAIISLAQVFVLMLLLVSKQLNFIARCIALPGYNSSSQAIDVPLEAKISPTIGNNTATGNCSLQNWSIPQHWRKYVTLASGNQASTIWLLSS
jgi:hypothetical protein